MASREESSILSRVVHGAILIALVTVVGLAGYRYLSSGNGGGPRIPASSPTQRATFREKADRAYEAKRWAEAAGHYQTLVGGEPTDYRSWFLLAYCLHMDRDLESAIAAYQQASISPEFRGSSKYNLGRIYAQQGKQELAIATLREAVDDGARTRRPLEDDPDLESLKDHPEFASLARHALLPLRRPEYRQLDFLLGEWELVTLSGRLGGVAEFRAASDGFSLVQVWQGGGRRSSQAMFYFDPRDRHWVRIAIDSSGQVGQFVGQVNEGRVEMLGTHTTPNGERWPVRSTWERLEDGRVHYLVEEQRMDDGKWTAQLDGIFRPLEHDDQAKDRQDAFEGADPDSDS